jgi:hypothetical protein
MGHMNSGGVACAASSVPSSAISSDTVDNAGPYSRMDVHESSRPWDRQNAVVGLRDPYQPTNLLQTEPKTPPANRLCGGLTMIARHDLKGRSGPRQCISRQSQASFCLPRDYLPHRSRKSPRCAIPESLYDRRRCQVVYSEPLRKAYSVALALFEAIARTAERRRSAVHPACGHGRPTSGRADSDRHYRRREESTGGWHSTKPKRLRGAR